MFDSFLNWLKRVTNQDNIIKIDRMNPDIKNIRFLNADSEYIGYLDFNNKQYYIISYTHYHWICRGFTRKESSSFKTMWS